MPSKKQRKSLFLDENEASDLADVCLATGLSQSELVCNLIALAKKKVDLDRSPSENFRTIFGSPCDEKR